MTINITIQNVLGVKTQSINVHPKKPVAIVGLNATGKTSIATAIAAVLSRQANPLGFAVTMGKWYAHEQADNAEVRINWSADSFTAWRPRGGTQAQIIVSDEADNTPQSHPAAVGLFPFLTSSKAEKGALFEAIFLPPFEELSARIKTSLEAHLPDNTIDELLNEIETNGWADVGKTYLAFARKYKSEWGAIAGEAYGKAKAVNWRPPNWRAALDGVTIEEAAQAVADAREVVQQHHITGSITAAQRKQASEAADEVARLEADLPGLEADFSETQKALGSLREHFTNVQNRSHQAKAAVDNHLANEPVIPIKPTTACPACGVLLIVSGSAVVGEFDEGELKKQVAAAKKLQAVWAKQSKPLEHAAEVAAGQLDELAANGKSASAKHETNNSRLSELRGRIASLKQMSQKLNAPVWDQADQDKLANAEQAEQDARAAEALVKVFHNAARAQVNVLQYSTIADIVGPTGLRAKAVAEGLKQYQEILDSLGEFDNWPGVKVEAETYAITIDDKPSPICSASEQWKAKVSLQIAFATVANSPIVVIDGADILDELGEATFGVIAKSRTEAGIWIFATATETDREVLARSIFQKHRLAT